MRPRSGSPPRLAVVLLAACGDGTQGPAPLDTKNDACAWCRMSVSDLRFAAQLTAPGHEPKFFDDAGCLRDWLKAPREEAPWTAWVTDHRTKEWVKAKDAALHAEPVRSDADELGARRPRERRLARRGPGRKGGTAVPAAEVIGPFPTEPK